MSADKAKRGFKIINKSPLHIDPPEFSCDRKLGKNVQEPLPNQAFFMSIVGSAGSGKTSFAINLLTRRDMYNKVFDAVHVVQPKSTGSSLKNDIFKDHRRMYHDLDEETLEHIRMEAEDLKEDGKSSLMYIDDMSASLKDNRIAKIFYDMVVNRRHYGLSIIVISQTYTAIPLKIRKTISWLVMFKPRNRKEAASIWEELVPLDHKTADELLRFMFRDNPYDFMQIETMSGRFFKNFDEVSIGDDELIMTA